MALRVRAITFREACNFIQQHHRHHKPPRGWKFGCAVTQDDRTVGVVIVGRPVARGWDHKRVLEVTRLCTDGTRNACSTLYAAAARAAQALGYERIITYTLASEGGSSLKASGWQPTKIVRGRSWTTPSRPREDKHPTVDKTLWERQLCR